jgi:DNA-binding transcriptional ArsR family regulator
MMGIMPPASSASSAPSGVSGPFTPAASPARAGRSGAAAAVAGRALEHPDRAAIRLEDVLHALADPVRLHIVRALDASDGEMACSGFALTVSKSTSTYHFRVLREAGVISQVYRGTSKMNGLRRADLDALFPGLLDSVLHAAVRQERRGDAP